MYPHQQMHQQVIHSPHMPMPMPSGGNMGDNWVPITTYGNTYPQQPQYDMPPHAVHGGHDSDGSAIYVGRSFYQGEYIPAKVIPNKRSAYICWNGQEILVPQYDILCGQNYQWQFCTGHNIPISNGVRSGHTQTGEPLLVGRGNYQGSLTVGKIHPSHNCLYIPYGGQEVRLDTFEILTRPQATLNWIPTSGNQIPHLAVQAGHDSDGDVIYVGRAYHDGDLLPAKVIINKGCAYVCHDGQEHLKHQFEVLCGNNFNWIGSASGHVPANAIEAGRTADQEILFIGRGRHQGSLTPGKIHPSHGCLYIPYGGQEVSLRSYEVLVQM